MSSTADRTRKMSFVDAPGLGRPRQCKVILGIEDGIAKDKVCFAMEVPGAWFRDDFNCPRPGQVGRIWGIVDPHFLNRGR